MAQARFQPSPLRLSALLALAVLALLAFGLLADVRFNYEDPTVAGVTDAASRATMTWVALGIEAVALIAAILTLTIHRRPNLRERDAGAGEVDWSMDNEPSPAAAASTWAAIDPAAPVSEHAVRLGCSGCGTVFEKDSTEIDEPHEEHFACPNCGRQGRLRRGVSRTVPIKDCTCNSCGHVYAVYRGTAECPSCHAVQG